MLIKDKEYGMECFKSEVRSHLEITWKLYGKTDMWESRCYEIEGMCYMGARMLGVNVSELRNVASTIYKEVCQ